MYKCVFFFIYQFEWNYTLCKSRVFFFLSTLHLYSFHSFNLFISIDFMAVLTNFVRWVWLQIPYNDSPLSPISRTHFLRFPSNSEAFASELLENLEEMYYRHCNLSNLQTYNGVLPVVEGYDRRLFLWHICHKNMTKL